MAGASRVADAATEERRSVKEFRRASFRDGTNLTPANIHVSVKTLTVVQVQALTEAEVEALMVSFREMLKNIEGSWEKKVDDWLGENIPAREVLLRRSLKSLAKELRADMKQARIGLLFNIGRSIVIQFLDEASDTLVLVDEYNGGDPSRFFWASLAILCVPLAANIWAAIMWNKKKGKTAQATGVLAAVLHLTPLLHGMKVWKGEGFQADDVVDPYFAFILGRVSELIFESLPELILQLYMVFRGRTSPTIVASLSMSVASASFMMMDASVGFERKDMNKQIRGPHSHPEFGFLPLGKSAAKIQQAGLLVFYAGTVSIAALAIAAVISVASWAFVPAVAIVEFAVFMVSMWSRGMKFAGGAQPEDGLLGSNVFYFAFYLMMCMAPWAALKSSYFLGGTWYAGFIAYRFASFGVVAYFVMGTFEFSF